MGSTRNDKWDAPPSYGGLAPFGAMDAKERLKRIDAEGLAAAILYPTMSLLGDRNRRPRPRPGVHARLQPLDRRLVL